MKNPVLLKRIGIGQEGAALIAAAIFIAFIGFLGVTVSFLFSSGTSATVDQLQSLRSFYAAEGGLEVGIRKFMGDVNYNGEAFQWVIGGQPYQITINMLNKVGNSVTIRSVAVFSISPTQTIQKTVQQRVERDPVNFSAWQEVNL